MDTSTIKIKFDNIVINNYIGKLFKYLKNIHTIAYFDIGENETSNTKNGLLSHAGVVDFTYPLGASPSKAQRKTNIIDMISNITIDKNSMLKEYSRFIMMKYKKSGDITLDTSIFSAESNLYNFVRYIGITAPPLQEIGPSPITQGITIGLPEKGYYKGGTNYNDLIENIEIKSASDLTTETDNKIMYNIYGHQPQFFVPTVSYSQHTTNVALDICKTDFKHQFDHNNYSFSMLKLDKMGDDIIFGRSAIHFSGAPKGYFYYRRPINDKLFKLPNKHINENIFINGSPFGGPDTINTSDSEETLSNITSLKEKLSVSEPSASGGSKKKCKHVCGPLCKKCHKHDHQCMLKCHLCEEENCHKRRKTRKHRKPKKSRRQRRKSRKNTRKK
tara:strand:- start:276 stop:1439 length:1164 start_codon:yes stop_codon:yes gene_type:complete